MIKKSNFIILDQPESVVTLFLTLSITTWFLMFVIVTTTICRLHLIVYRRHMVSLHQSSGKRRHSRNLHTKSTLISCLVRLILWPRLLPRLKTKLKDCTAFMSFEYYQFKTWFYYRFGCCKCFSPLICFG